MADAFFEIIKQREENEMLTIDYFSEEEVQIMERIIEKVKSCTILYPPEMVGFGTFCNKYVKFVDTKSE